MRKPTIGSKIKRISSNTERFVIVDMDNVYCVVKSLTTGNIKQYKLKSITSNWCKV